MIRLLLLFMIALSSFSVYSQKVWEIVMSFNDGGKAIKNVKYYLIQGENAELLKKKDSIIMMSSHKTHIFFKF